MKAFTKIITQSALLFLVFQTVVNAQIKVGNNPQSLNEDAILEIESANKGVLLPRVALTDVTSSAPLSQHVAGMVVYNTATVNTVTPGFYYNDGTRWIATSGNKPNAVTEQFIITTPRNTFTLKNKPATAVLLINGTTIDPEAYSISDNILTYNNNSNYSYQLVTGDKVTIRYIE